MSKREQKLIDLCFQLILFATSDHCSFEFKNKPNPEKAQWVANQLKRCGFNTVPVGYSWGILKEEE